MDTGMPGAVTTPRPAGQVAGRLLLTACALGVVAAAAIGLWPVLLGVHRNWASVYGHFAHGYLVLVMALWLAWRGWRTRPDLSVAPWWPAVAALVPLLAALSVTTALSVDTVDQSLLPLVLLALAAGVFGLQVARVFLWPILFLYCALPIWWIINTPLQLLTIAIVNPLVRLSGAVAYIEGNRFHFPSGVIEIASLCSGLNYMVAALSLALFQGMLYLRTWRSRTKLLAAAVAVSLLANWVRVYSLMLIGYYSEMQNYLIRVEHIYYGWVLFLVFLWPVFAYGARLEGAERRQHAPVPPPASGAVDVAGPATALAALLAGLLLLLPALFQARLAAAAAEAGVPAPLGSPGDSTATLAVGVAGTLSVPGALERRESFYIDGRVVEVYRARYALGGDRPDAGTALDLLADRWRSAGPRTAAVGAGGLPYEQQPGRIDGRAVLVRSGLTIAGVPVATSLGAKRAALAGLPRLRGDGYLWLAAVECRADCAAEQAVLDHLLERQGAPLTGTGPR
jgi:exosortase